MLSPQLGQLYVHYMQTYTTQMMKTIAPFEITSVGNRTVEYVKFFGTIHIVYAFSIRSLCVPCSPKIQYIRSRIYMKSAAIEMYAVMT